MELWINRLIGEMVYVWTSTNPFITARVRSTREGNVLTRVCPSINLSVHGGGGQSSRGGVRSSRGWGRGSAKIWQQKELLLRGGRYASCVHAGGLSCFHWFIAFVFNTLYLCNFLFCSCVVAFLTICHITEAQFAIGFNPSAPVGRNHLNMAPNRAEQGQSTCIDWRNPNSMDKLMAPYAQRMCNQWSPLTNGKWSSQRGPWIRIYRICPLQ